jgi:hypothetical protein
VDPPLRLDHNPTERLATLGVFVRGASFRQRKRAIDLHR